MTYLKNAIEPDEQLGEEAPAATDAQLSRVSSLAQAQVKIRREIADLELALERKEKELQDNMWTDLPEAMGACGMEKATVAGGLEVSVGMTTRANIPEEHKDAGIAYLNDHGGEDLVKHRIVIEFDRKDQTFFRKFLRDLAQRKRQVNAEIKDTVAWNTLTKWVKERYAQDDDPRLPVDLLGIFRRKEALVNAPKPKDKDEIPA